jgi:NhaP-type Na+/H+ and K+/H+ antiporter
VQELATVHGIALERDGTLTLEEVLAQELRRSPCQGDIVRLQGVELCAREIIDGKTTSVSVRRASFMA